MQALQTHGAQFGVADDGGFSTGGVQVTAGLFPIAAAVILNVRNVLIAKDEPFPPGLIRSMQEAGILLHETNLPRSNPARSAHLGNLDPIEAGVTSAIAGIAETGTLVLNSGSNRSQLASLLPPIHIAVLPVEAIFPSQREWFDQDATHWIGRSSSLTLISGPSRTADIEMTLTIGVHGPGKLFVVCYT